MEVGGEQEIWADVVAEIEREVEERAIAQWATPASIELPNIKIDPISLDESRAAVKEVDKGSLTKQLWAARWTTIHQPAEQPEPGRGRKSVLA